MNITSAAGIISLLDEQSVELKSFALKKLNTVVDEFWPEISEVIEKIEILYEDKNFDDHELAALVASKVYYHLGSFDDSLIYALGARNLFDVNSRTEYVETILSKCIDFYIQQRVALVENSPKAKPIDPRLEGVVNRMFERCLEDGQYCQAVGLALETRRMDIFEVAVTQSDDVVGMLNYAFDVTLNLIPNLKFRNTVLRCLVNLYQGLETPDYVNMCQCFIFLDDAASVASILDKLIQEKEQSKLMAYQISFDLYESATQQYLERVFNTLRSNAPLQCFADEKKVEKTESAAGDADSKETKDKPSIESLTEEQKERQKNLDQLYNILSGKVTLELHLQFLVRSNHADLLVLKYAKEASRVNICHTATIISNAYMHSGTTSDQFLRDNLEWLTRATNWAKFTAVASLGVIHRGHEQEALSLLQSYLPKDVGANSGYSEGGALYALGLIHANHGANISDYLLNQLKEAKNEIIRHGCCLGLGLATMGTNRQDVYEQLKFNLYQDDAVTGEAAGIGMGLVMLGSKNTSVIEDMVSYAQESQHEKILRGLALGISFIMYGRLEEADTLIDELLDSKNPIFRRAGAFTIAMAYCGTAQNKAIRKLLHIAVSDVNDDVRRAAVTSLGFLLFSTPEQCPSVVSLLAESYNPHVRYGAAMALGIACAGTGLREAIAILEPMIKFDSVNFVRQGALIATAMILIQQNEQTCPKVPLFRRYYYELTTNKHEDVMTKFGAILAQGIIDAGGRNVTLSLQSRTGHTNMLAVVGTHIFTQYWYWFPLTHCLSLAFTPSCVIALNADLKMPKLDFKSNVKPSMFAYPPPLEEKKREEREKISTVVLSSVARQRKRDNEKKQHHKVEEMKVDEEKKKEEPKKKEPEPTSETLNNPARALRGQLKYVSIVEGCQYVPMKDVSIGGIIMVRNTKPGEEEIVESVSVMGPKVAEENEPEPPEPFEWTDD
ncbi:26S proteasome non-ATPase regulatory subunit 1-like [Onthophagus taurus]|uniref:26S proteasome non-ATPase regulatory subunit 1-like n=1 Tax=Onthophagus taurus TaxID=166361 RepID=UPI000C207D3D|nr:26S proteasome non-ATPase regulatory subunit 1-like [Onthophagus taurus]